MANKRKKTTTVIYERKPLETVLTWYMDRYKTQRQKNTTLSRRASTSVAARLNTAPMRHSSSIPVCVSKPSRGPNHSRVGKDSSCSTRGLPLYRSCQRAGSSPSLPYRPRNIHKHQLQQHQSTKYFRKVAEELYCSSASTPLEKCHPFKTYVMD